jgi:hypothetical protein
MTRIDDLLPEQWPPNVISALSHWHQGHLIEEPPLFWGADPRSPLLPFTAHNGDPERDWQIFSVPALARPPYGVLVSQTCDICEARPVSPFVDVAPVYDIADSLVGGQDNDIKNHCWNNYVYLTRQPAPDRFFVADLRIFLPIEKGALAGRQPVDGFDSEADRLDFADRVATRHRRPAYADAVHDHVIAPLDDWIRNDAKNAIKEHSGRFTDVEEVRLRIEGDRLNPQAVQLVVFQETALSREDQGSWRKWREGAKKRLTKTTSINLLPIQFSALTKMPAAHYRQLAPVWLRYLGRSPRS